MVGVVHVVVVDPSRMVLKAVSRLLTQRDHRVRAFVDGREALEHIKVNQDAEVLITSTEPLSISGVELCWETRLLASYGRPIHIILMSSNDSEAHLIQALDCGADDCIGKPPAPQELYARLRGAERLSSMQRELTRLAEVDPLTSLFNRRAFFARAQDLCARSSAAGAISAIMFDVDHFKRVNDEHGHDVGDEALRGVARAVAGVCPIIGRLGGEEFAIVLEGSDLAAAVVLAERLRESLSALRFETAKGPLSLTCSFGVSEWLQGDTIDGLLKRADLSLYAAKHGGRNRVVATRPGMSLEDAAEGSGVIRALRQR
jgi:two-component system, cell cycle response regulator